MSIRRPLAKSQAGIRPALGCPSDHVKAIRFVNPVAAERNIHRHRSGRPHLQSLSESSHRSRQAMLRATIDNPNSQYNSRFLEKVQFRYTYHYHENNTLLSLVCVTALT
jgi:hypothetical protein